MNDFHSGLLSKGPEESADGDHDDHLRHHHRHNIHHYHWLWSSGQVGTVSHPKVQTLSNRTPDAQPAIAMEGGAADRNHSGEGQGGTHTTRNHRGGGGSRPQPQWGGAGGNPHHREPQEGGGIPFCGGGEGGPSSAAPCMMQGCHTPPPPPSPWYPPLPVKWVVVLFGLVAFPVWSCLASSPPPLWSGTCGLFGWPRPACGGQCVLQRYGMVAATCYW